MGSGWEGEAKSAGLPTKDLFQRLGSGDKWEGDFQVDQRNYLVYSPILWNVTSPSIRFGPSTFTSSRESTSLSLLHSLT